MSKKINDLEAKLAADKEAVAAAKGTEGVNLLKDEQARTELALNAARMAPDRPRESGAIEKLASEVATNKRALEIAMQADAAARAGVPRVTELQAALKASEAALAAARRASAVADTEDGSSHPFWKVGTFYAVGAQAMEPPHGGNWESLVAHTSGTGTMAQDRAANPGHWRAC